MQNHRLKQQQQQQQQALMQQALLQQQSLYHPGLLAPPQVGPIHFSLSLSLSLSLRFRLLLRSSSVFFSLRGVDLRFSPFARKGLFAGTPRVCYRNWFFFSHPGCVVDFFHFCGKLGFRKIAFPLLSAIFFSIASSCSCLISVGYISVLVFGLAAKFNFWSYIVQLCASACVKVLHE